MANRMISGNVTVIDSGLSALPYYYGKVAMIAFYGSDTTAKMVLTLVSDTTNAVSGFASGAQGAQSWSATTSFGGPWAFNDTMYCLTLVAGTGWVYYV